jgi:hypothetical protein
MGRKTIEGTAADRLTQASAEAAAILSGDLAACRRMMRSYLDAAAETQDEDVRAEFIHCATELVGAVAKLSTGLAQVRGETRQYIRVARPAPMHPNAPQNAPNKVAPRPPKPRGVGAIFALRLPPNCHPGQAPHRWSRQPGSAQPQAQASRWVPDRPKGRPG